VGSFDVVATVRDPNLRRAAIPSRSAADLAFAVDAPLP
jgi:hypothetical protein